MFYMHCAVVEAREFASACKGGKSSYLPGFQYVGSNHLVLVVATTSCCCND
jgi:hypothetical protein